MAWTRLSVRMTRGRPPGEDGNLSGNKAAGYKKEYQNVQMPVHRQSTTATTTLHLTVDDLRANIFG